MDRADSVAVLLVEEQSRNTGSSCKYLSEMSLICATQLKLAQLCLDGDKVWTGPAASEDESGRESRTRSNPAKCMMQE